MPKSKIAELHDSYMFTYLGPSKLFSRVAVPFTFLPGKQVTQFFSSLSAFSSVPRLYYNHCDRCIVIANFGLNLYFLNS